MSGGAYAASKYVITSTKQIKPSVLKSLTVPPDRLDPLVLLAPAPREPQGQAALRAPRALTAPMVKRAKSVKLVRLVRKARPGYFTRVKPSRKAQPRPGTGKSGVQPRLPENLRSQLSRSLFRWHPIPLKHSLSNWGVQCRVDAKVASRNQKQNQVVIYACSKEKVSA
jgi:hypothetical protein